MTRSTSQLALSLHGNNSEDRVSPEIFVRLKPAVPTPVYETYWRLAAARQEIFFQRVSGSAPPWTDDPILQRYKFTNAYRASDRTSQFLIRRVIYDGPRDAKEQFFRTMLFKLFNKIETWDLLEQSFGEVCWRTFSYESYDEVLSAAFKGGQRLYSAAYIVPSPGVFGSKRKHRNHLRLLEQMMIDEVPERIATSHSMHAAFELLRSFPSIGDFLAYQFVTDLNYSTLTNFSESQFVVPGPGALDGIRKCFADLGGLNEVDVIKFMADRQEREFEELGIEFRDLWGRRLQYIDCQNLFCEVGKYARVAHPTIEGTSGRTRIKQGFRRTGLLPQPWYPPKWEINDRITSWQKRARD